MLDNMFEIVFAGSHQLTVTLSSVSSIEATEIMLLLTTLQR